MTTYDRPPFDKGSQPELVSGTWPGIRAEEPCESCNSEGYYLAEVGSRWTNWQGGMWVPDEREIKCGACDGHGTLDVTRCARCGGIHETSEENQEGVMWCDCDEDDIVAWQERMLAIEHRARVYANAAADAEEFGVSALPAFHGLTWNELHYLNLLIGEKAEPIRSGESSVGRYAAFGAHLGRGFINFFGQDWQAGARE